MQNRIVVPTELLAQLIETEIGPRVQRELSFSVAAVSGKRKTFTTQRWAGKADMANDHAETGHEVTYQDSVGWQGAIASRASAISGKTEEALVRRLYSVLHRECLTTDHAIAEYLLLAADINIEDTDLPVIPASMPAAIEMADAEYYAQDKTPDESQLTRRARRLYAEGQKLLVETTKYEPARTFRSNRAGENNRKLVFKPFAPFCGHIRLPKQDQVAA